MAEEIDEEVQALVVEARDRAKAILVAQRDLLDRLASRLLEVETLEGEDLARMLEGGAPAPPAQAMKR